jgi:hypothetical protein
MAIENKAIIAGSIKKYWWLRPFISLDKELSSMDLLRKYRTSTSHLFHGLIWFTLQKTISRFTPPSSQ